jgi:hypothetical protein
MLAGLVVAGGLTGVVFAASAPVTQSHRQATASGQYQLDIRLELASEGATAGHARQLEVALCMAPGEPSSLATHGIELDATTQALARQRVRIDLAVRGKPGNEPAPTRLEGEQDRPLQAFGKVPGEEVQYILRVTPRSGCPASASAAAKGTDAPITMKVEGRAARQVVDWIATQADLALVNPEAIDERKVSLNFQGVPATSAMQLVAGADGMRAVFEGQRVRFEPQP